MAKLDINIQIELTPTQARMINSLKEKPCSKFELEEAIGKKIEGCSESLIKTQICLINSKYKARWEKPLIELFVDHKDGINKYRLTKDNPEYKMGKKISDIHELAQFAVHNTEDLQRISQNTKEMNTKMFYIILVIAMIFSLVIGALGYKAYWDSQYTIVPETLIGQK